MARHPWPRLHLRGTGCTWHSIVWERANHRPPFRGPAKKLQLVLFGPMNIQYRSGNLLRPTCRRDLLRQRVPAPLETISLTAGASPVHTVQWTHMTAHRCYGLTKSSLSAMVRLE